MYFYSPTIGYHGGDPLPDSVPFPERPGPADEWSIDLNSPEGWKRVEKSINNMKPIESIQQGTILTDLRARVQAASTLPELAAAMGDILALLDKGT